MNEQEFNNKIWGYYVMLESDFLGTFRYVEFSHDNDPVYSKEYIRQLLSIGSEVDIVCKVLCEHINPCKTVRNIDDYRKLINPYNDFLSIQAKCLQNNELMSPWQSWAENKNPDWWHDYNGVKHDRIKNDQFKLGNLKNVTIALCGLYVLCRVLYKSLFGTEPEPHSQMFMIEGWAIHRSILDGAAHTVGRPEGGFDLYIGP